MLGIIGAIFIFIVGMTYLEWQRRKSAAAGEGPNSLECSIVFVDWLA